MWDWKVRKGIFSSWPVRTKNNCRRNFCLNKGTSGERSVFLQAFYRVFLTGSSRASINLLKLLELDQ